MPSTLVRPYQTVIQVVAAVWLIVAVGAVAAHAAMMPTASGDLQTAEFPNLTASDVLVIAGFSGLIAIAATVPGWTIVIPPSAISESDPVNATLPEFNAALPELTGKAELSAQALAIERLGQAFLAGMLIRITGTVALFLASSYYMETSPTRIGIWVLGWHLVLLLTEVIVLSRQIRVS